MKLMKVGRRLIPGLKVKQMVEYGWVVGHTKTSWLSSVSGGLGLVLRGSQVYTLGRAWDGFCRVEQAGLGVKGRTLQIVKWTRQMGRFKGNQGGDPRKRLCGDPWRTLCTRLCIRVPLGFLELGSCLSWVYCFLHITTSLFVSGSLSANVTESSLSLC